MSKSQEHTVPGLPTAAEVGETYERQAEAVSNAARATKQAVVETPKTLGDAAKITAKKITKKIEDATS